MVINTSNNLTELGNKTVRVNSSFLNFIYNSYIGRGAVDSTIYGLLNKYMGFRYQEEYIIGRPVDMVLMNPLELKLMVDFTGTDSLLKNNVKESPKTLTQLIEEQEDINSRYRMIKTRECGNVIKMIYAVPVQVHQPTKQEMIDQIAIANNAQSRVSAEVEKAKQLVLK